MAPQNTQHLETHQLVRRTMALVLAGGRGSRLKQLTDRRAKPAVYFGGKYRIIDFTLSNCLNSGIRRIGVATQYKSHSLMRHIQSGWSFLRAELGEMVEMLPAQQRIDEAHWYRGTADAVYQNLDIIRDEKPDYVIVLAGDHIYKQDYSLMIKDHVDHGVDCTVGCIEVPRMEAVAFGVMHIDEQRNVTAFLEKPADPPAMPGKPDIALASMGIYVFSADYLYRVLEEDLNDPTSSHDFGRDVIPRAVAEGTALAHPFGMSCVSRVPGVPAYWRDVGTIDAFWEANIDLAMPDPQLDLYDTDWPIWTYQRQVPPAKFVPDRHGNHGVTVNTMISGGCILSGTNASNSVFFSDVRVHSFCRIDHCVILPDVTINRNVRLHRVVVDRGCVIPEGMVVGEDARWDAERFERTENGIVLITKPMLEQLK
ncbi:MAG: glucose-1-phosphate adenylyltransferase [Burkholderiales bacterium]